MHKKLRFIIAALFLSGLLAGCQQRGAAYREEDFSFPLDIDFKSSQDLQYFDFLDHQNSGISLENALQDGALLLQDGVVGGANLKTTINQNTAVHVRWMINAQNTCVSQNLWPRLNQELEVEGAYGFGYGGCSYQGLAISATDHIPLVGDTSGTIVLDVEKWVDTVFWVDQQDPPTIHLLAWETENPAVYYVEEKQLVGLDDAVTYLFSFERYFGAEAIDTFRIINGDIESYLWFYTPPFRQHTSDLKQRFFSQE